MGWMVNVTSRPFYPLNYPVPIVQEAGWAPGSVWTGAENLAVNGIWFSDRPARSLSLYWQLYLNSIWEFISYHTVDTCNFHCTEIIAICYSGSYRVTGCLENVSANDKVGGTYRFDCVLKGLTGQLRYRMPEINMQTYRTLNYLLLITYLPTPCSRVLLEKLTDSQLVKKLPTFYGTLRFITAFTSARQLSLSWTSLIQSIPPHPTSWMSILILSSHLRLSLPSDLVVHTFYICSVEATVVLMKFLVECVRHTCWYSEGAGFHT